MSTCEYFCRCPSSLCCRAKGQEHSNLTSKRLHQCFLPHMCTRCMFPPQDVNLLFLFFGKLISVRKYITVFLSFIYLFFLFLLFKNFITGLLIFYFPINSYFDHFVQVCLSLAFIFLGITWICHFVSIRLPFQIVL